MFNLPRFISRSLAFLAIITTATVAGAADLDPKPDDGISNDVHRANAGRILFSKTRSALDLNKEKPGRFTTKFDLSDEIHFRVYLSKSMRNHFRGEGVECHPRDDKWRVYTLAIDGKPAIQINKYTLPGEFFSNSARGKGWTQWTTFRFPSALNGRVKQGESSIQRSFIDRILPVLTAGEHTLALTLTGRCLQKRGGNKAVLAAPMAAGEFTLHVTDQQLARITAKSGAQLPKAGRKDKRLQREMKTLASRKMGSDKVLKVIIRNKRWNVVNDRWTGRPVERKTTAAVAVKQSSGKCKVFDVLYVQKANGRRFGRTELFGVGRSSEIPCGNIK